MNERGDIKIVNDNDFLYFAKYTGKYWYIVGNSAYDYFFSVGGARNTAKIQQLDPVRANDAIDAYFSGETNVSI